MKVTILNYDGTVGMDCDMDFIPCVGDTILLEDYPVYKFKFRRFIKQDSENKNKEHGYVVMERIITPVQGGSISIVVRPKYLSNGSKQ